MAKSSDFFSSSDIELLTEPAAHRAEAYCDPNCYPNYCDPPSPQEKDRDRETPPAPGPKR